MAEALPANGEQLGGYIANLFESMELDRKQQEELDHLVKLLDLSEDRARAIRFVEYLSRLPIDSSTLIAGIAFCAIEDQLMAIERVRDQQAKDLVATLMRLASVDSAASTSALLQVRRNRSQTENVRGMLVAMIDDPRVIVLKFVERLVQLKVVNDSNTYQVKLIAEEVLNFYAPLASRLGIWNLKWTLEDAAYQHLEPERYKEIAGQLAQRRLEREERVSRIQSDLSWRLGEAGVTADIQGRAKNIYGIDRKMKEKDLSFNDVRDVIGIRVIVDSVPECYQVLGIVHLAWPHLANEFDDYIANPKSNGYRSLHTAVYGPQGHIIEVQIRTHQMHLEAELGVCSHWEYKGAEESLRNEEIDWLREVLNWHEEFLAQDQGEESQFHVAKTNRVTYVQTPKRHVVDLPSGSTVLDFAFKVHSEIGLKCIGAQVDGEDVALNRVLNTGEMVEVITEPEAAPQRRWLDPDLLYFKNSKTRDILRSYFTGINRQVNIDFGRQRLEEEIHRLAADMTLDDFLTQSEIDNQEEFLVAISLGSENPRERILQHLETKTESKLDLFQPDKQLIGVKLVAVDRRRLARDITDEIASLGVNVVGLQLGAPTLGQEAHCHITIEVDDLAEASVVVVRLRRLYNVADVWITKYEDQV